MNDLPTLDCLHCNKCFILPSDFSDIGATPGYVLTNCGHVFCLKCQPTSDVCEVCGVSPIRHVPLEHDMKPDVKFMFQNSRDGLKTVYKVLSFQNSQVMNLVSLEQRKAAETIRQLEEIEAELNEVRLRVQQVTLERDKYRTSVDQMRCPQQGGRGGSGDDFRFGEGQVTSATFRGNAYEAAFKKWTPYKPSPVNQTPVQPTKGIPVAEKTPVIVKKTPLPFTTPTGAKKTPSSQKPGGSVPKRSKFS